MIPGLNYVRAKFDELNALCFDDALPPLTVRLSMARSYLGMLKRQPLLGSERFGVGLVPRYRYTLFISKRFDRSEAEVEDTLLHEMIHYWIFVNGLKDTSTHGQLFRAKMAELNTRFGRHIGISYRMQATTEDTAAPAESSVTAAGSHAVVQRLVCVLALRSGQTAVSVVARTRALEIHRAFARLREVERVQWYSSHEGWFARFPAVRSVKAFTIDKDEVAKHLTTATPLTCDGKRFSLATKENEE